MVASVWPDAFAHDERLGVGHVVAAAPDTAGELPHPLPVGGTQGDVAAVETQPDVGSLARVIEDVAGEPHDRRRVVDAQKVAFAAKPHLPE